VHRKKDSREHLTIPYVLSRIDLAGTLFFFLGILLCIDALDTAHLLDQLAGWMTHHIGNIQIIAVLIGFISAIIDNVPLVAASMGMYNLEQYAMDHPFWQLIAYCAGTGGSVLIIGSAAGVVYMSMERVSFFWYLKRVSLAATAGYLTGVLVYSWRT
jgi:Na+/H+ antiporter NhaD/arsenite permease-like protein